MSRLADDVVASLPAHSGPTATAERPRSFLDWRSRLDAAGIPGIVAVAGSRGKTTVARLADAIFREANLRTVVWTDRGVDIEGRHQRGELVPWSKALAGINDGRLDVAVQELDWDTVHAVGLPRSVYPIVTVTNLCVNNDSCLIHDDTPRAFRALARIREAVATDGVSILDGDDAAVADVERDPTATRILFGRSPDAPLVRRHFAAGGTAAWRHGDRLWIGREGAMESIGSLANVGLALGGAASFQVMNVLAAASIGYACGIPISTIARAIRSYVPLPETLPGSFNVLVWNGATVVVDRPAHPWFLRPALRALGHFPTKRLVRVVGRLDGVGNPDLVETGRLLGRGGGAILLHSQDDDAERSALLLQGIAANDVPPIVIRAKGERSAIGSLLRMLHPDDLVLIIADKPLLVVRALERAEFRPVSG